MMIFKHKTYFTGLCAAVALTAARAAAQGTNLPENPGTLNRLYNSFGGPVGVLILVAVLLVIVVGLGFMLTGRRRGHPSEELYPEPSVAESSRFEQLLAETQGLFLRVQGGESKGYFRKIERLTRIFLERIGIAGALLMPYDEMVALLNGGALPQKQSVILISILERCRQGSEHEGAKVDFTAGDLIKDLRLLVKQAAEETSPKTPL